MEKIRFDILVVMHLMGDLNQPLHTGYAGDQGGNLYQVSYLGQVSNLHRVWDSQIIETANITYDSCLTFADAMPQMELSILIAGSLPNWIGFPGRILDTLYPANHKINKAYVERMAPVIKQQLVRAGLELAKTLHDALETVPVAQQRPAGAKADAAAKEISLSDLTAHIDETVKVCGKVYGVKCMVDGGKYTFVNVGAAYPNSPLTLFITSDIRERFSYKPEELDSKDICVTGELKLCKGKPEIKIRNQEIMMQEKE